jgi:hypothetical protein
MSQLTNSLLFPRNASPYDITWERWAAIWCNWFLSIPKDRNPSIDMNGKNCAENQTDPHVWFLGGTFGNENCVRRKCVIPFSKSILFPIIEKEDSFAEDSDLRTDQELITRAKKAMDAVTLLEATIDGINIENLANYRVLSYFFELRFPENNVYDLVPCATRSVCDGYWIFLKPLPKGKHRIHFRGECSLPDEQPAYRIMNDRVFTPIKKFVENYHTFKVEVFYELIIQ